LILAVEKVQKIIDFLLFGLLDLLSGLGPSWFFFFVEIFVLLCWFLLFVCFMSDFLRNLLHSGAFNFFSLTLLLAFLFDLLETFCSSFLLFLLLLFLVDDIFLETF